MSALLSHLDALLARDRAKLAEFCRVTGFPMSTIQSMRLADSPKPTTLARLRGAIDAWKKDRQRRDARASAGGPRVANHDYFPDAWEKAAASASDAYVKALGGRRFTDAGALGLVVDLGGPRYAASREPCPRCGVRGDVGCSHQQALGGAQ